MSAILKQAVTERVMCLWLMHHISPSKLWLAPARAVAEFCAGHSNQRENTTIMYLRESGAPPGTLLLRDVAQLNKAVGTSA
ncbi:hypothetical protein RRG08_023150 [Elysia crispata]|uniref:Uncharacterized protein n=1 Tax=Elysia crispata TaxID=231223 RepID=A0AAE0XNP2_9GAST|nr:hypothetical protein RRG08_023150 [Elysia crispata]